MNKTILTYGTFDLFNVGHLRWINRLSAMGGRLIVGISTDEFSAQEGKACVIPYADRAAIVASIRGVDLIIAEGSWEQKPHDIKDHDVTHLVMGREWEGKFDFLKPYCEILYLEPQSD